MMGAKRAVKVMLLFYYIYLYKKEQNSLFSFCICQLYIFHKARDQQSFEELTPFHLALWPLAGDMAEIKGALPNLALQSSAQAN